MNSKKKEWELQVRKSLKIAVTVALSIGLADRLGLNYPVTAGIITILSIGNTKKETLLAAGKRGIAFLYALCLAFLCFHFLGYTIWSFSIYVFVFAAGCLLGKCGEAIAMDSVLISHLWTEQSFSRELLLNEVLLLVIGAGLGVLVNLHLHREDERFERLSNEVDDQIKEILHRMSLWIPKEDKSQYNAQCFDKLDLALQEALFCAAMNYDNSVLEKNREELAYIEMREKQSIVLKDIYQNIKRISYLPQQAKQVAMLFGRIEQDYHKNNTVEILLEELERLLADFQKQALPLSRDEFEARAILFYILMQTKNLLEIKKRYWEEKWEVKEETQKNIDI